jgi:deoxyadenosine/deoxycytidine kinase
VETLRQGDMFEPIRVADFLMDKDRLFARLTLDSEEYRLYEQVYAHLALDVPRPDLVIYLQAPVDVLVKRIAKRGIPYERAMETAYLRALCEAYTKFFHYYDEAPLLIVNAADINLVEHESDYEALVQQIGQVKRGRHFFNPMPEALRVARAGEGHE